MMDMQTSMPPHSIEAEQSVLGGLLLINDAWHQVCGRVGEKDFYRAEHRLIFQAIGELLEAGHPCDAVTLGDWFERHGRTAGIGGTAYLAELANNTPSAANIAAYADIVRGHSIRRRLMDEAARITSAASAPNADIDALLGTLRDRIDGLAASRREHTPRILLSECANPPPPDFVLPGLLAGTVGMLVGAGAIGKSTIALQFGVSVALGLPVAQGDDGELFPAPPRGAVAIAFGEDNRDEVRRRGDAIARELREMQLALADGPSGLHIYSTVGEDMRIVRRDGHGFAPGPWLPRLRALAQGKRLVIVDPLAFTHDCDENDNGAMTYLMRTAARVADETGAAVLFLHHTGKFSADDGREDAARSRGASALTTAARVQYDLRSLSKQECAECGIGEDMRGFWLRFAVAKANYLPPQAPVTLRRLMGGLLVRANARATPSEKRYGRAER